MTEDYNLLEEYSNCIKECLEHVTHDHQMATDSKVLVLYATAPIAYAKEQEHFANGSNVGPLITFYQSGIEIPHEQQMGAWKYLPVVRDEGNYMFKAPVICRIKYTVTINALTELQADMLQAQIMQATPFHRPYYTKFNGQFVLIESSEPTNLGSVDAGGNTEKITRRQLTLTIDRAYLYYDIKELNAGTIHYENGSDGNSLEQATIKKNTSKDFTPYIYNVIDDDGKVIGKKTIGKIKLKMYSFDRIKS